MRINPLFATAALLAFAGTVLAQDDLYERFKDPPAEAKPFVRWWWNGNRVTEKEIRRELQLMQKAGIGGVEINPVAMPEWADKLPDEPVVWLSPEWCGLVRAAAEEARRLGMVTDLIVGTGWPFGGEFLKPGDTLKRVNVAVERVDGPKSLTIKLSDLAKENHELLQLKLVSVPVTTADATDLLAKAEDGKVSLDVPAGEHRIYAVHREVKFRQVQWGAPGGAGEVLDHFKPGVLDEYLNRMSSALAPTLGGKLGGPIRAMFCDSIELREANWTDDLPEEFEKRRGYRLGPWLPFILDHKFVLDNKFEPLVQRARYDFSQTLDELFMERFILPYHRWCGKNGTLSRYQAYGSPWLYTHLVDGSMVPDIPEGDAWIHFPHRSVGPILDGNRYAVWNKHASSGGHVAGRRVSSSEAMTNVLGVFQATLETVKQATDLNYMCGVNHLVLHGFNYSPPEAGFPGWVRYGTYFNENNTWWPHFPRWADYAARVASLLQDTKPVTQVAILGPTADVRRTHALDRTHWIETPPYLHFLWQALHQNGFSCDYVSDAVVARSEAHDGLLRCGAMEYGAIILADVRSLEPETAEALARYAGQGGRILFAGSFPNQSPGLHEFEKKDAAVRKAVSACFEHPSRVRSVKAPDPGSVLSWVSKNVPALGVPPGMILRPPHPRLFQIQSRKGDRDIYFLCSLDRGNDISFEAYFPTGEKTPWRWDPETGIRHVLPHPLGPNRLRITLSPLESLILVFEPFIKGKEESHEPAPATTWDSFDLRGPWDVTLQPAFGEPSRRKLAALVDFGDDPDLRSFSGTIVYRKVFGAPSVDLFPLLDLGRVHDISEVKLNGKPLGVRWYGRHRYPLAGAMQQGRNELEIRVTTTLYNYCRSIAESNKCCDRWTVRTAQNRNRVSVPSGLLGPVSLLRPE